MHVRTDRYGETIIHDDVAHKPTTVHERVTNACIPHGIIERGKTARVRNRAIALIEKHSRLTAEEAVLVVLAGLDKEAT